MAIWNTIQFLWSCFLWESTVKSLIAFVVSGFLLLLHGGLSDPRSGVGLSDLRSGVFPCLPPRQRQAQPRLLLLLFLWLQGSLGHTGPDGMGWKSDLQEQPFLWLGAEVFTSCIEHWGCPCPWWVMPPCTGWNCVATLEFLIVFNLKHGSWGKEREVRRWWPRGWCRERVLSLVMQWAWWVLSLPSSIAMRHHFTAGYQFLLCLCWHCLLQIYSPDCNNTLFKREKKKKKKRRRLVSEFYCTLQKKKFSTCLSHFSSLSFFLLVVNTPFAVFS